MAQTKQQVLTRVTDFCNKSKFNFTATSLEKFSEESVKLFDVQDVKEDDVYSSLENQLKTSYQFMSSGLAAASQTHKQEKTDLENLIAELKKQNPNTTPATQPATPQQEKPDVAAALMALGLDDGTMNDLKTIIEERKTKVANEKIIAHTKEVIDGALKNIPESRKDDFNKFVIGRAFFDTLENDVKKLNEDFKESIKGSDDIDIEAGGSGADANARYSEIVAAKERILKKQGKVTNDKK